MVTTTKYVWDPVFDCVTHELDENNAVKAVYHNEPQQYGGVLSQRRGNTSHYHHHDALGSTRFLTDSAGNVTDTYLNDAWGNSVETTGTTVNPFRWVGKYGYYTDNSTGQVYIRARMYEPSVARWYNSGDFNATVSSAGYRIAMPGNDDTQKIDVKLLESTRDKETRDCPDVYAKRQWRYKLTGRAREFGFIIQKVTVFCHINKCQNSATADTNTIGRDEFTYYEAWSVKRGNDHPTEASATDTANFGIRANCIEGNYSQTTTAKFVSKAELGLENTGDRMVPGDGWIDNRSNNNPTRYGKPGICQTDSGKLMSSGDPAVWNMSGGDTNAIHGREFQMAWACCPRSSQCCANGDVRGPVVDIRTW